MTIHVWGVTLAGLAAATATVGTLGAGLVGGVLLMGFVQSAPSPSASQPFFSNDAAGLLKILVIVVLPIVGGIGAWVWKLSHTQEKQDLDRIGGKINGLDQRAGSLEARMSGLEVRMGEDRLAAQSALFESQKGLMSQMNEIRNSLTRVEGKVCDTSEMRDAVLEGMRSAVKDVLREREK